MHEEIEAKLKIDSLDEVERRLRECGAAFLRETVQTDTYFDTAGRDLTRSDECLRLRREVQSEETTEGEKVRRSESEKTLRPSSVLTFLPSSWQRRERLILAYKGPKERDDFKKRAEVELGVSDAVAAESLLAGLGYRKVLAFDKRRRLWRLHGCEVALDTLPLLGVFVEIEGPDSGTIACVQEMLGLAHAPHTMDSYASLIEHQLSRLGEERREVYLEDRK